MKYVCTALRKPTSSETTSRTSCILLLIVRILVKVHIVFYAQFIVVIVCGYQRFCSLLLEN